MKKLFKSKTFLGAVLSIALCASLIAGATFAIFTSESKVNIAVTSGTVKVTATVSDLNATSPEKITSEGTVVGGYVAGFTNGGSADYNGNEITLANVTPGDKVTFNITVNNQSNVDIKYRVVISDPEGSNLADALKITIAGEEFYGAATSDYTACAAGAEIAAIPVSIELPVGTNNDWQDKTVKFSVTVEAVQGNTDTVQKPITFDQDGEYKLTGIKANGVDGVVQVTNGTVTVNGNGKMVAQGGMYGTGEYAMAVWARGATARVIINGGRYSNTVNYTGEDHEHYDLIYASSGATIEIYGGTFQNVTPKWTLNCKDRSGSKIYVMGGRYYKFDPANAETTPNGEPNEIVVPQGYKSVKDGDWYEVVKDEEGGTSLEKVFVYKNVDFGYGSTSTEAVNLDGNGVAIANWVDAWVNSDTTIKNVVFKNGAVFSAKADNVTVTLENCTFYACDQSKLTYTGNNSLTNSGAGMCLNLEKSAQTGVKFIVKNCTFIGENDKTLSAAGPRYNADGTQNGTKKRGHAIAIDAICGGGTGTLDSLLIEGCVIDGVRGNAIQLYGTTGDITIKDTKINSWAVNNTGIGYAIRGDFPANGSRTLTLTNVYFGLNEIAGNNEFGHVKVGSFSGNTNGNRTAGTY